MMRFSSVKAWLALVSILSSLSSTAVFAETPRSKLLDLSDIVGHSLASKRALRPIIEKATPQQISELDRGRYFEELGEAEIARQHFVRAVGQLNEKSPGNDAWCVAYKLLRIRDEQVDRNEPAVKEMLALRKTLSIPLSTGDLEKTATTAEIKNRWQALPDAAQTEDGPLPKTLNLIERAVALAVRGFNQDDTASQPSHASARCYLSGPNLKPFYGEGAKLGLVDFQYSLANDLSQTSFVPFWETAGQLYAHIAQHGEQPYSVLAGTALARISERLLASDSRHPPPLAWPEIIAQYRKSMEAGHEVAWVLYANAVHQGLGGLSADEAEAVRLYKALLDRKDTGFYSFMALGAYVYAQEQLTTLWQAGKLPMTDAEQSRYLTLGTKVKSTK